MIKPSELPAMTLEAGTLIRIESYIDSAIEAHALSGAPWPLTIKRTRSGWRAGEVEAVLEKYRAAGWVALTSDTAMAVLSPPSVP